MRRGHDVQFEILYPQRRYVSGLWILLNAKDHLATEYMRRNPGADQAAIEENARIRSIVEAMDILSDAGLATFTRPARDFAERLTEAGS